MAFQDQLLGSPQGRAERRRHGQVRRADVIGVGSASASIAWTCGISAALRGLPVEVAHIGSTAVPGLEVKPVIDVQVGCPTGRTEGAVARIQRLGFEWLGEAGVPGRQYLRRRSGLPANVHVVGRQGRLWADNLLFRDYLITHPDAVARYAAAKREAARRAPTLLAYSDLKAQVVAEIMRAARGAAAGGRAS
ncbi:GrpB family protein [Streptomyces sp. NPDC127178]|uniref:GrpB family protein n=1 Tax=unclassified Streptomyces TaxID=2593676 RepID=UPI0036340B35